jgi:hypothetical protein
MPDDSHDPLNTFFIFLILLPCAFCNLGAAHGGVKQHRGGAGTELHRAQVFVFLFQY